MSWFKCCLAFSSLFHAHCTCFLSVWHTVVIVGWCVASLGPVLRCVVVCSRVLHPKMHQSLEYFGCPLVVVLLQSISMTLAPLPFCPFVFYWTCDLSPLIWSLVDEIILYPVPVHMDWKLHLWVCKCLPLWNSSGNLNDQTLCGLSIENNWTQGSII